MAEKTSSQTTKTAENTTPQPINFKLADHRVRWRSPDKSIDLNRFTGKIYGSVDIIASELNYQRVQIAINVGDLIDTEQDLSKKVAEKEEVVEINNIAEKNAKHRMDASRHLRKLKKADLLVKVAEIKNPYLIAAMIEQESRGRNVSRRRREDIITALKKRLDELSKTIKGAAMIKYSEVTNEGYQVKKDNEDNIEADIDEGENSDF